MPENQIEKTVQPATQEREDQHSLSNFAFDVMKGAAMGAASAAGSVGRAVGEGVAAGVGAMGAGPKAVEAAKDIAEGAALGGIAGGIISGALGSAGRRVAEGAVIGAATGAVGAAVGGALSEGMKLVPAARVVGGAGAAMAEAAIKNSRPSDVEGAIRAGVKELLDTPKQVIDRAQSKPLQTAGEVLIFGPIGPVIGTKAEKLFDKYFGK